MKRKKRRRLRKRIGTAVIVVLIVVILLLAAVFAFQIKNVEVYSDLGQFTQAEVENYMKEKNINSTLLFWFRNKTGHMVNIDLFEDYDVSLNSLFSVTIDASEKKLCGYVKNKKKYFYLDADGMLLKKSKKKIKGVAKITGINAKGTLLYEVPQNNTAKQISAYKMAAVSVTDYEFNIRRIDISDDANITLYTKNVSIKLGNGLDMDKKLLDLNDMYENLIKYSGVLDMTVLSSDGSYILKKTKKNK